MLHIDDYPFAAFLQSDFLPACVNPVNNIFYNAIFLKKLQAATGISIKLRKNSGVFFGFS